MSVCVLLACRAHGDQKRVSGSLEQELSVAVNLRVGAWKWPESILCKPATALSHRAISSALVHHSSPRQLRDKGNDRHRPVGSQTQQQSEMCKTSRFLSSYLSRLSCLRYDGNTITSEFGRPGVSLPSPCTSCITLGHHYTSVYFPYLALRILFFQPSGYD